MVKRHRMPTFPDPRQLGETSYGCHTHYATCIVRVPWRMRLRLFLSGAVVVRQTVVFKGRTADSYYHCGIMDIGDRREDWEVQRDHPAPTERPAKATA